MEEYPNLSAALARIIRQERQKAGLSKRRLSELAMLERAYITSIETGKKKPTLNALFYLATAMGVTPSIMVKMVEDEINEISRN